MPPTALGTVLHDLRRSLTGESEARRTDGELLEDFVRRRDEFAFAALVRRHGPMVLGVCRRVLRNEADADDAFQATFLVLMRKARSVRPRGLVGNWLYGVAHRTALKAKAMHTKRQVKEREAARRAGAPDAADPWEPLSERLDQELQALPDIYRAAIVLCDLEGASLRDAARQLGCPQGTVGTRLARGRRLLARRLARHRLAVSGAAITALLTRESATAGVPAKLFQATIQAATRSAAGPAAARGEVSARVAALTEGVLKSMLLTRLKIVTAVALALAVLGAGARELVSTAAPQGAAPAPAGAKPESGAQPATPPKATGDQAKPDAEPINHIWITEKAVQEELNLTEAQVKKIQAIRLDISKKYEAELKKAQAEAKKQNFAAYKEVSHKIQDEERKAFAEEAPKILSAGAIKRLLQIQRQARGLHNLIQEPAIKKKLKLDDEQLQKIEAFLKEGAAKAKAEFAKQHSGPVYGPIPIGGHIAFEQKMYADAMKKVLGVLTEEQRRTWNELVGEPFVFKSTTK